MMIKHERTITDDLDVVKKLLAGGMSADVILEKLK